MAYSLNPSSGVMDFLVEFFENSIVIPGWQTLT